jgi:hypothetical protein
MSARDLFVIAMVDVCLEDIERDGAPCLLCGARDAHIARALVACHAELVQFLGEPWHFFAICEPCAAAEDLQGRIEATVFARRREERSRAAGGPVPAPPRLVGACRHAWRIQPHDGSGS